LTVSVTVKGITEANHIAAFFPPRLFAFSSKEGPLLRGPGTEKQTKIFGEFYKNLPAIFYTEKFRIKSIYYTIIGRFHCQKNQRYQLSSAS
jgi:hypothetical protein